MKNLRYIVTLGLVVLLLAGCTALPPVIPAGDARGAGEVAPEPTAELPAVVAAEPSAVPATEALATEAPATNAPAAESTPAPVATEVVTDTATAAAPVDTSSTPTAEQVMGANPLVDVLWEWTALLKTATAVQAVVPDPASYTLTFGADGSLQIRADCNNAVGTYTLENDVLTITLGPVTLAACPPGSFGDLMLTSLSQVGNYLIDGSDLVLRIPASNESLMFRNGGPAEASAETEVRAGAAAPTPAAETPATAAPAETAAPELVGTLWQWERFVDVATGQASMDVKNSARYTVTFLEDGTAAMQADCNRAVGAYTVDNARLTITIGPVTLAACGPDSLGETFLVNLTNAGTYTIEEGKLNIDLFADSGRMIFGPAE